MGPQNPITNDSLVGPNLPIFRGAQGKLSAALASEADEETMLGVRREMDRSLAPYRRKMSAAQLAQLEHQYIQKRLFEHFEVPRLSLFYLT